MQSVSSSTWFIHARRLFQNRKILLSSAPIGPFVETPDGPTRFSTLTNAVFDSGIAIILSGLIFLLLCTLGVGAVINCRRRWRVLSQHSFDVGMERAESESNKMAIKALPATVYRTDSPLGALDCPLCLGEFMDGEKLRVLPECCHSFHADCIDAWLVSNPSCPSCRHSLLFVGLKKPSGVPWPAASGAGMDVTERNESDATNPVVQT